MTTPTTIHETVREHYAERIKNNASCCGPDNCCSPESNLYPEDLLAVVDSLTKGTNDELEKVKRIYYWVQDHISYVAIENGYRGFIPHKPQEIFTKR